LVLTGVYVKENTSFPGGNISQCHLGGKYENEKGERKGENKKK
jgi:hypothetical protein